MSDFFKGVFSKKKAAPASPAPSQTSSSSDLLKAYLAQDETGASSNKQLLSAYGLEEEEHTPTKPSQHSSSHNTSLTPSKFYSPTASSHFQQRELDADGNYVSVNGVKTMSHSTDVEDEQILQRMDPRFFRDDNFPIRKENPKQSTQDEENEENQSEGENSNEDGSKSSRKVSSEAKLKEAQEATTVEEVDPNREVFDPFNDFLTSLPTNSSKDWMIAEKLREYEEMQRVVDKKLSQQVFKNYNHFVDGMQLIKDVKSDLVDTASLCGEGRVELKRVRAALLQRVLATVQKQRKVARYNQVIALLMEIYQTIRKEREITKLLNQNLFTQAVTKYQESLIQLSSSASTSTSTTSTSTENETSISLGSFTCLNGLRARFAQTGEKIEQHIKQQLFHICWDYSGRALSSSLAANSTQNIQPVRQTTNERSLIEAESDSKFLNLLDAVLILENHQSVTMMLNEISTFAPIAAENACIQAVLKYVKKDFLEKHPDLESSTSPTALPSLSPIVPFQTLIDHIESRHLPTAFVAALSAMWGCLYSIQRMSVVLENFVTNNSSTLSKSCQSSIHALVAFLKNYLNELINRCVERALSIVSSSRLFSLPSVTKENDKIVAIQEDHLDSQTFTAVLREGYKFATLLQKLSTSTEEDSSNTSSTSSSLSALQEALLHLSDNFLRTHWARCILSLHTQLQRALPSSTNVSSTPNINGAACEPLPAEAFHPKDLPEYKYVEKLIERSTSQSSSVDHSELLGGDIISRLKGERPDGNEQMQQQLVSSFQSGINPFLVTLSEFDQAQVTQTGEPESEAERSAAAAISSNTIEARVKRIVTVQPPFRVEIARDEADKKEPIYANGAPIPINVNKKEASSSSDPPTPSSSSLSSSSSSLSSSSNSSSSFASTSATPSDTLITPLSLSFVRHYLSYVSLILEFSPYYQTELQADLDDLAKFFSYELFEYFGFGFTSFFTATSNSSSTTNFVSASASLSTSNTPSAEMPDRFTNLRSCLFNVVQRIEKGDIGHGVISELFSSQVKILQEEAAAAVVSSPPPLAKKESFFSKIKAELANSEALKGTKLFSSSNSSSSSTQNLPTFPSFLTSAGVIDFSSVGPASVAAASSSTSFYVIRQKCILVESLGSVVREVISSTQTLLHNQMNTDTKTFVDSLPFLFSEYQDYVYSSLCPVLLPSSVFSAKILQAKWDPKDIQDKPNDYTESMLNVLRANDLCLRSISPALPTSIFRSFYLALVKYVQTELVEAFSRVKKCTTEGRALMTLDISIVRSGVEKIAAFKPLPAWDIVMGWINAYYFSSDELVAWAKEHCMEYSALQLAAIANTSTATSEMTKKERTLYIASLTQAHEEARKNVKAPVSSSSSLESIGETN